MLQSASLLTGVICSLDREGGCVLQVAADTVLFTPVYVAAFFAFMNSMDGGSLKVKAPHAYSGGAELCAESSRQ